MSSCSKWLLNKKGPLAAVWVAAFRRVEALSRDQVASTDIVAVVDKILQDARAPQRILALLLLGIVKIYYKKVQYVYDDCSKFFCSIETRRRAEPSTSTGTSMQLKKAVHSGRRKDANKVKKSIHAVRITQISGSISSEGVPVMTETEINIQASVVVRETRLSADMPAFTMPTRFELDSFNLGIAEDIDDDGEGHHQSGHKDISLEDERRHAPFLYESNQRPFCLHAVDSACLMPEYIALPPEVIDALTEVNNTLDWSTKGHEPERENQNADSIWFTPVKDVLPPEIMESMTEGKDPSYKTKTGDKSTRKVNMDEDVGPTCSTFLSESQEQPNVFKNMTPANTSASYQTIEELENGLFQEKSNAGPHIGGFHEHETDQNELSGKSDAGLPVGGHQKHVAEEESLECPVLSCRTKTINDLSPSTPEHFPECIPGPSSTFMVRTPAKTEKRHDKAEKRHGTKKRKRSYYNKNDYLTTEKEEKRQRRRLIFPTFDEVLVLPNYIMENAIRDASDITQRRKKAPHTCLNTWKVAKIGSLLDNFMDPLIPYQSSVHLASITTPDAPESSCGEVKARRRLSYKYSESSRSSDDAGATEQESIFDDSRKRKLGEPTDFEAPVAESGNLQDNVCGCNDDTVKEKGTQIEGDGPISVILSDKVLHESENQTALHNEASYSAQDNINELQDTPMDEEHTGDEGLLSSIRTRKIARFLHQQFLDRNNNQGTNSSSLNQILAGKERRAAAIFFHETLVLKSRDLIEVGQEQPYEDIVLSPTPQLGAELQKPSGGISR